MLAASNRTRVKPHQCLNPYHTMTIFDALEEKAFWKHCGKRRKCWLPAFSSLPAMFSILWMTTLMFSVTFNFSSANAFNLGKPKILPSGKGLKMQWIADLWQWVFWWTEKSTRALYVGANSLLQVLDFQWNFSVKLGSKELRKEVFWIFEI